MKALPLLCCLHQDNADDFDTLEAIYERLKLYAKENG